MDHCTELYPIPFSTLVERLAHNIGEGKAIYGYRSSQWWKPKPGLDLSIAHAGGRCGTPLGPASGPHTQLAQNLVMAWLCGARFMELKTVQVLDDLEIPRPCIHVPHVGYNVEWSQELRIHQSAREYVKGWLLIHILAAQEALKLSLPSDGDGGASNGLRGRPDTVFDMSLGYDLEGVQSEKVRGFIASMTDASSLIDELRGELPDAWAAIDVPARISSSTTLSTFHGCPADEIEAIATHTMREHGLHTVVKLNPTLLGFERVRDLVTKQLGYDHIEIEPEPFEKDLKWAQLLDMIPRLVGVADEVGVQVGFKLTNTLVMQSPEPPFGQGEMYLSGPPLHVIALTIAAELRQAILEMGIERPIPLTFSAGVDANNFADCVAAGLSPVTTCSDLLKSRGYARLSRYLKNLEKEMAKVGATDIAAFRRGRASEPAQDAYLAGAATLGELTSAIAEQPAYARAANTQGPKKVGSELELFDCLTCDICIPVCPNGANFAFPAQQGEFQPGRLRWEGGRYELERGETLVVTKRHQIGCCADACNQCGECDVWCPEDGGPYLVKPNVFLSRRSFDEHPERLGFLLSADHQKLIWRRGDGTYTYTVGNDGRAELRTPTGRVMLDTDDRPLATDGDGDLDLTLAVTMRLIREGLSAGVGHSWIPAPVSSSTGS